MLKVRASDSIERIPESCLMIPKSATTPFDIVEHTENKTKHSHRALRTVGELPKQTLFYELSRLFEHKNGKLS